MVIAVGGNGKAQFGVQAQHLIDHCPGVRVLFCVGGAGRLADGLSVGDVVVGTSTIEHDYKRTIHSGAHSVPRRRRRGIEAIRTRGSHSRIPVSRALRAYRKR
jgi:nucleoside phosphorylase